jgi:hypothetical protein
MKRYRERRHTWGNGGGDFWEERVVELANDAKPAEGAAEVPAETPLHDWTPEHLLPAEEAEPTA